MTDDPEPRVRMSAFRRVLLGWAALCAVGWLGLGILGEIDQARCRADYELLCFGAGQSLAIAGVVVVVVWLVGAFIAWIVKELIWPSR